MKPSVHRMNCRTANAWKLGSSANSGALAASERIAVVPLIHGNTLAIEQSAGNALYQFALLFRRQDSKNFLALYDRRWSNSLHG